jgi:NitT/TauT family transport system ATP-binding protein
VKRIEADSAVAAPLMSFQRVGVNYDTASGTVEAIRDVSLDVRNGEFVAIIGPSGCGKSTLLRIAAGLRPASAGQLTFRGEPVTDVLRSVGMVFQAPILLPWRSILDNVLLGAQLSGARVGAYRARALELLEMAGLADFAAKYPKELSGGMQQRVSLCRALLLDPAVLLMDEPFGALDAMTRDEMNLELMRIWGQREDRKTVLFVTHSIPEAVFLADRVVVMSARPGQIARVVDVPLTRPRSIEQRATALFGEITLELYDLLKATHPGNTSLL